MNETCNSLLAGKKFLCKILSFSRNVMMMAIWLGYPLAGAPELFSRGQSLKKGTFFVEKALPTKANFRSHAAI